MISSEGGMDRSVVDGTLGRQNGTAIPQGKTQTGRTVQEKIAVTSQQISTHYYSEEKKSASRVTMRTASANTPEIVSPPATDRQMRSFQQQVTDITQKLQKQRGDKDLDDFLFYVNVVDEFNALKKNNQDLVKRASSGSEGYKFMVDKMAVIYEDALSPVLEMLKSHTEVERLWIYGHDFLPMAQTFKALTSKNHVHKEALGSIYRKHIAQELNNIEYLIKFIPDEGPLINIIYDHILWLIDKPRRIVVEILGDDTINEFKSKAEELINDFKLRVVNGGNAGNDKEQVDKSEKHATHEITRELLKRKHHENLFGQLREIMANKGTMEEGTDKKESNEDPQKKLCFLEEIAKLCKQHDDLIGEKHTKLKRCLTKMVSSISRRLLLKMQGTDGSYQFKNRALSTIDYLANGGWFHEGCKNIYRNFLQTQNVTGESVKMNQTELYAKYHSLIGGVYDLLDKKVDTKDNKMLAIEELRKLMLNESDILAIDMDGMLNESLKNAKHQCALSLFFPIFDLYSNLKAGLPGRKVDTQMSQYKKEFIELNPYTFVLSDNEALKGWQTRACAAWHDDIEELMNATLFREDDVNNLLQFKSVAPDVPNPKIYVDLQRALIKIFQFVIKDNTSAIPIEKVTELSKWVDHLRDVHGASKQWHRLQEINEEWKQRYKNTAGDRTMTSSDTSTKTPPVFVHPGIVDIPLSTDDCHSRTERQITPDMQPVTVPLHMPALAINQPFQHSVLPLSRTATDQPFNEIRPQSEQLLQAYHGMPTARKLPGVVMMPHSSVYYSYPQSPRIPAPATQQPFQQSASTPYYTVTEQTPVGIRPQPNQPLQLQPLSAYHEVPTTGQLPGAPMTSLSPVYPQPATPYVPAPTTQQPFQQSAQQSASTPYYTVTEQTPVEIRPQPNQPLQLQPLSAYHEVPTTGQLPGAPMTSHFPVNPYAPQLLVYGQPQPKWQPVYQQPYENQSTISSEPRANYSFSSNTQLSEMP